MHVSVKVVVGGGWGDGGRSDARVNLSRLHYGVGYARVRLTAYKQRAAFIISPRGPSGRLPQLPVPAVVVSWAAPRIR